MELANLRASAHVKDAAISTVVMSWTTSCMLPSTNTILLLKEVLMLPMMPSSTHGMLTSMPGGTHIIWQLPLPEPLNDKPNLF